MLGFFISLVVLFFDKFKEAKRHLVIHGRLPVLQLIQSRISNIRHVKSFTFLLPNHLTDSDFGKVGHPVIDHK